MQQVLGQDQLGQSQQIQQSSLAQAQQQMAQTQLVQQSQIAQQQMAQQQMAQQQIVQTQMAQQQNVTQTQMTQQQLAQTQMAQQQIAQQQIAQQQIAQTQMNQQQITQPQLAQQHITQPQIIQQQILQPQMMQQIGQQQISQQQLQQMMYCPTVRLVYETPMIMQSGDQMQQQNQNIFTNQPPWARTVQNPVIYLQQIGPNLVPVQHIDPNMFLQQNIPIYQQVVQNVPQLVQNLPQTMQSLPQGQIRHIMNTIPPGMMPNFSTNIQRMPDQNIGGQMVQNFGLVQTNQDANMNSGNIASNDVDRQAVTNQANTPQNVQNQDLTHVYRQLIPQINQQQIRAQVPVSSQQQNVQAVSGQQSTTNLTQNIGTNVRPVAGNSSLNIPANMGVKINNNVRPNSPQIVQTTVQNMNQMSRTSTPNIVTNVSTPNSNIQQVRHIIQTQNVNVAPQSFQQNMPITSTIQSFATSVGNLNTVTYSAVRNGQPYTYRAIQPKPNSNIRVNFKPRINQVPVMRRPIAPNINQNNQVPANTVPVPTTTSYIKMETENPTFNRKRKSESPDEVHKKISNYGSITVTAQVKDKIKAKYANTNEIGVNTSPVHKYDSHKVENSLPLLQISPMEAKVKQEFLSPPLSVTNPPVALNNTANVLVKTESGVEFKEKRDSSQQTEEKLVRKTVFPQAKVTGRLLDAKANLNMPSLDEPKHSINIMKNDSVVPQSNVEPINKPTDQVIKPEEIKVSNIVPPIIVNQNTTVTHAIAEKQNINVSPAENNKMNVKTDEPKVFTVGLEAKTEVKPNEKAKKNSSKQLDSIQTNVNLNTENTVKTETSNTEKILKTEKPTNITKTEASETKLSTDFDNIIKDNKIEKKEYKNISLSEMAGKEIHIVDGNIHKEEKEKDFVLTHVLDGYVIQESNVPFAIRRPLKEKTVNAYVEDKNDPCIKAAKEEIRGQLSQLHLNESIEKEKAEKSVELKEDEKEDTDLKENEQIAETKEEDEIMETDVQKEDDPFDSLKQSLVKTWTVDDLATHLNKFNWNETVATLQEHEIDGESLFLVTKTQLVTIGINEAHAEVICQFVGSKN